MKGHRGFDLDGERVFPANENEINLVPVRVPEKTQPRILAAVDAGLQGFDDHHILEKTAEQGIAGDLFPLFDAQEVGGEPRLHKIYLAGFDKPLANIPVIRWKPKDDEGSLKDGQPFLYGFIGDSYFSRDGACLEKLADSSRQDMEKGFEFEKILDHEKGAKVTLDIGLKIAPVGAVRFLLLCLNPWKKSLKKQLVSLFIRRDCIQFQDTQGEEREESGTPSQRLGYGRTEPQLMTPGEHELPISAFLVRQHLDCGKQFGCPLHFIDNKGPWLRREEGLGIAEGLLTPCRILEIHIAEVGAFVFGEGGFTGLPGTENGNDGILRKSCLQFHSQGTWNIFLNDAHHSYVP